MTTLALTPLASLSADAVRALAALHCAVMPTLLTDLGQPVVVRYYELALRDPQVIGFAAFDEGRKSALGWVVGSPHPAEMVSRLRRPLTWFALQMARVAVMRPRALLGLVGAALAPAAENSLQSREIELTYIGVAPAARGQGLGVLLIQRFVAASQQAGYNRVSLSVETDNPSALRIYRQTGFEIVNEFHEGRFHRYRMSKVLASQ